MADLPSRPRTRDGRLVGLGSSTEAERPKWISNLRTAPEAGRSTKSRTVLGAPGSTPRTPSGVGRAPAPAQERQSGLIVQESGGLVSLVAATVGRRSGNVRKHGSSASTPQLPALSPLKRLERDKNVLSVREPADVIVLPDLQPRDVARNRFFLQYDKLHSPAGSVMRPPTGKTRFLQRRIDQQLAPEPIGLHLTSLTEQWDISHYAAGDALASAAACATSHMEHVHTMSTRDNRLTDKSLVQLCNELPPRLRTLDISGNRLGVRGAAALGRTLGLHASLEILRMERMPLTSAAVKPLAFGLIMCRSIRVLDMTRCKLDARCGRLIGDIIKQSSMTQLSLGWNSFGGVGALHIATAIRHSSTLKGLDLSWNALGVVRGDEVSKALAEALAQNSTLVHLDLSHNLLNGKQCSIIAHGLARNHTLCGLHMEGNNGVVDSKGFVEAAELSVLDPRKAHTFTRVIGMRTKRREAWLQDSTCWICGQWREMKFMYTEGTSGPAAKEVRVAVHFDDWKPDLMDRMESEAAHPEHIIWRMVPPGKVMYHFVVTPYTDEELAQRAKTTRGTAGSADSRGGGAASAGASCAASTSIAVVAKNQLLTKVMGDHTGKLKLLGEDVRGQLEERVNFVHAEPQDHLSTRVRPRATVDVKSMWTRSRSVFASYIQDSDELLDKCFEADWAQTKIHRIVKSDAEMDEVKGELRAQYALLYSIFKYYCTQSQDGDVYSITWTCFTELCADCDIPDQDTCQTKTIDTIFIATNVVQGAKNPLNPDRALVRFQLVEAVVRLALAKFEGRAMRPARAVQRLLEEYIQPHCEKKASLLAPFRELYIWNEAVDATLRTSWTTLSNLYQRNSGSLCKPGQPRFMAFTEWMSLVDRTGLVGLGFTQRDAKQAFLYAMMTQIDDMASERSRRMTMVEFLEAVCRLAFSFRRIRFSTTAPLSTGDVDTKLGAMGPSSPSTQDPPREPSPPVAATTDQQQASSQTMTTRLIAAQVVDTLEADFEEQPLHLKIPPLVGVLAATLRTKVA